MKLSTKISLIIISVLLVIFIIISIIGFNNIYNNKNDEFKSETENLMELNVLGIKQDLYNLDVDAIKEYVKSILKKRTVSAVIISEYYFKNKESKPFIIAAKDEKSEIRFYRSLTELNSLSLNDKIRIKYNIIYDNTLIGSIESYFDDSIIMEEISKSFKYLIIVIILMMASILITMYFLMDVIFLKPFRVLEDFSLDLNEKIKSLGKAFLSNKLDTEHLNILEITNLEIEQDRYINREDELGKIFNIFLSMVQTLQSAVMIIIEHSSTLEEFNEELESKVVKRTDELRKSNIKLQQTIGELKKIQSQLIQQEKLASIGQLAAGIAHEINNPTGYIMSNLRTFGSYINDITEIIECYREFDNIKNLEELETKILKSTNKAAELDLDFLVDDSKQLIKESLDGAKKIKVIVQNLKSYSKIDNIDQFGFVKVEKEIESTLKIIWNKLKYDCKIIKEYAETREVYANSMLLNQVFTNIFFNSLYAVKKRKKSKGNIWIRTYDSIDSIKIEIEDDGLGIPADIIDKIYDPFFTTKNIGEGTGLGLNISYDIIVNKHNGKIECDSKEGKGTKFTIYLPVNFSQNEVSKKS